MSSSNFSPSPDSQMHDAPSQEEQRLQQQVQQLVNLALQQQTQQMANLSLQTNTAPLLYRG